MPYEPTNWKSGDVVTSAKLNKLENGVANSAGFLKVTASYDEQNSVDVMDKTWQEIHDALANGEHVCFVVLNPVQFMVQQFQIIFAAYAQQLGGGGYYKVVVHPINITDAIAENINYTCATANDYPQHSYSDDKG